MDYSLLHNRVRPNLDRHNKVIYQYDNYTPNMLKRMFGIYPSYYESYTNLAYNGDYYGIKIINRYDEMVYGDRVLYERYKKSTIVIYRNFEKVQVVDFSTPVVLVACQGGIKVVDDLDMLEYDKMRYAKIQPGIEERVYNKVHIIEQF